MSAATIIRECNSLGVRLTANGHKLHVEAPAGTLTPKLRERLVEAKAELLAVLGDDAEADRLLAAMYRRVAAAFDVRPWPIPGPADDHHQADLEDACRRHDLVALRQRAERYASAAEAFAALLAGAVRDAVAR